MKLIQYIVIALLCSSITIKAQNKKAENTLLWEISGKDLQKPSYLFGTYHYVGKNFIDTMNVLNAKLNQADVIVGELIMDNTLTNRLVPSMIMLDTSLDKLLTPNEYRYVDEYLKKNSGEELKSYNIMKPATVTMAILKFTAPKSTITAINPAIDQYLQDFGKTNDKTVIGLETVEEQGFILFGNSLTRQKEILLKSIRDEKRNRKEGQKIYNEYITQNLTELEKTLLNLEDFTPEEFDLLFKNRNEKWLTQLPALMQNKSLFIAVGAGHLVGENGLIKGLRNLGYQVNPVATN
jgi:uncharacterized protein YbaP (TraB family)